MLKKIIKFFFTKILNTSIKHQSLIALLLNYKNYFKDKKNLFTYSLNENKIIFLIPENKIFLYFIYQSILGIIFRRLKYDVYFLKCYNNLNFCKVVPNDNFDPFSGKFLKKILCNSCNNLSIKFLNIFKFKIITLKNLNTNKIISKVKNLDNLYKIKKFKFEGLHLGKLSLYDFHINQKKTNLSNLNSIDFEIIKKYILSTTNLILNLKKIIKKNFAHFIVLDEYCSDFAINIYLKKKNLSVFRSTVIYHKNEDPTYLSLTRTSSVIEENFIKLNYWKKYKKFPLQRAEIISISDDLDLKVFGKGTHNFSNSKNINFHDLYKEFNISKNNKIVVLFSSSEDEHCALSINYKFLKLSHDKKIFKNNFEWIDETIKAFSFLNNCTLIIKFHPRIGKTFRDSLRSDNYDVYKNKYLNKRFKNVIILDPETSVSSYDLADLCDLALVGWGTIGLELARLGVPVIVGMQSFMSTTPNLKLLKSTKTKNDYFKSINSKFDQLTIFDIIEVFRWYNLHKLSNSFHEKNIKDWRDYKMISSLNFSKNVLFGFDELLKDKNFKKEIIDINYSNLLKINHNFNYDLEKKEIIKYISNINKKFKHINTNSKISNRLCRIVNN
jgi:hypothetical protein